MTDTYDKIEILKGLEAVRRNPGMYISDITGIALFNMYREIVDNAVDEFFAGYCDKIIVKLYTDGSLSILDNGRGIPVSFIEEEGITSLEAAISRLHAGAKFNSDGKTAYKVSGGLHGVGSSVVNALSSKFTATVWRDKKEHTISFEKGEKTEEFKSKKISEDKTGTLIKFSPDPEIFDKNVIFNPQQIKDKLRELSFLCSGLTLIFIDENTGEYVEFPGNSNIAGFVKHIAIGKTLLDEPIYFNDTKDDVYVDVSFQWALDLDEEVCKCFSNNIINPDGGSHLLGYRSSLTRQVNSYISKSDLPKTMKVSLNGEDIREGLISIVSIRDSAPQYSSQTKEKLVSEHVRVAVEKVMAEKFSRFLEENPAIAKKIITRCVNSFKAREAAKRARESFRKTEMNDLACVLPGKLTDCSSKNPEECELYVCEGASASGTLKMARDRYTMAILPLRGKILNIEKSEFQKLIKSEEIMNIVKSLGCGIGRSFDISQLRYNKIILTTDADVDGAHICTLLLTFFYRQMPQLILNGNIYIAQPPLFRLDLRGKTHYLKDEAALKSFMKENKIKKEMAKISRFKGLGEMVEKQLWDTTMNPKTRTLLQVKIDNIIEAEKYFSILMGSNVGPRKDFIINNSKLARVDV